MLFHVIDDHVIICEYLCSVFHSLGHHARYFHSSGDYLAYLDNGEYRKPDAVFTDVNMPVVSGSEVVRRVKAIHPDQKFVIISGDIFAEGRFSGECLFLNKPFKPVDVENIIQTLGHRIAA